MSSRPCRGTRPWPRSPNGSDRILGRRGSGGHPERPLHRHVRHDRLPLPIAVLQSTSARRRSAPDTICNNAGHVGPDVPLRNVTGGVRPAERRRRRVDPRVGGQPGGVGAAPARALAARGPRARPSSSIRCARRRPSRPTCTCGPSRAPMPRSPSACSMSSSATVCSTEHFIADADRRLRGDPARHPPAAPRRGREEDDGGAGRR